MKMYRVFYKMSYGDNTWSKRSKIEKAENQEQALRYCLLDLEADFYEYDWLRLEPGQYSNGAEYAAEDENCLCVVCFKDFEIVEA